MPEPVYSEMEKELLLQTAADSIDYGLLRHEPFPVVVDRFPSRLQAEGASFVTLHLHDQLRGCIGSTEAYRPLILDVASNAFAASQRDPRFSPVTPEELADLALSVSILSLPEAIPFQDEEDLLRQLQPGQDGLIIDDGSHRATFLPQVWEQLPDRHEFLHHLKRKAGLRAGHGSCAFTARRYSVIQIGAHA